MVPARRATRSATRRSSQAHATNYDLPPTLLAAVIYAESKFDPAARSAAGAVGLMQLLPDTARGIATRTGGDRFVVDDLLDPELNVRYGSWYLRSLLDRYDDDVRTALAAYHAGPGNVDAWRRKGVGIQFPETRAYVSRVLDAQRVYADAYAEELGCTRVRLRSDTCSRPPIASRVSRCSSSARAPRSRARAGRRSPSRITPRKCPISCAETSERRRPCGLTLHDPGAAPLARVLRRDRLPALAELAVGSQAAPELEVDGEPVGVVAQHRVEDRLEALLGEDEQQPLVVACRERDEELLLRREPVEDRTARETDLLLEAHDGRALVAVRAKQRRAPSRIRSRRSVFCASVRRGTDSHFTKQYVRLI